jgi:hypothetical protein
MRAQEKGRAEMHVRPSPAATLYRSLQEQRFIADRPVSGLSSEPALVRITFPRWKRSGRDSISDTKLDSITVAGAVPELMLIASHRLPVSTLLAESAHLAVAGR